MWGSVAEVLFGEQQQGFAVHLERSAGDGPQGELLLCPAEPLGHVLPAPEDGLQACGGGEGGRKRMKEGGSGGEGQKQGGRRKDAGVGGGGGEEGRKRKDRKEEGGSEKDIEEVEIKGGGD